MRLRLLRYFQYNSKRLCPFWNDTGRCFSAGCRVKRCSPDQIPIGFQLAPSKCDTTTNGSSDAVDVTIAADVRDNLATLRAYDAAAINFCEPDSCVDCDFVDVTLNPERHTGYSGDAAKKIWNAVYQSNEGKSLRNKRSCLEKSFFYCTVSGLQSSINIHIVSQYRLEFPGSHYGTFFDGYGPNSAEFMRRFHPEVTGGGGPTWLRNLYLVYLIELKALIKISGRLRNFPFFTGNDFDDQKTRDQVQDLLESFNNFPDFFDDSFLSRTSGLESEFFNMSRVMDCIECDKCKLWGKLQVSGMGTALKVLLADLRVKSCKPSQLHIHISRNEIVALFNAFGRISTSIRQLKNFPNLMD